MCVWVILTKNHIPDLWNVWGLYFGHWFGFSFIHGHAQPFVVNRHSVCWPDRPLPNTACCWVAGRLSAGQSPQELVNTDRCGAESPAYGRGGRKVCDCPCSCPDKVDVRRLGATLRCFPGGKMSLSVDVCYPVCLLLAAFFLLPFLVTLIVYTYCYVYITRTQTSPNNILSDFL